MTVSPQLDYAPAPPKRRKWIRRALLLGIVAGVSLAAYRFGPRARWQLAMLYWQRQCLRYTAPSDFVVYEEEPTAAAALLAKDSQYSPYAIKRGLGGARGTTAHLATPFNAAAFTPKCWRRFTPYAAPAVAVFPGRATAGATAFLHARTSPVGHRRLVSLCYFPDTNTFTSAFIASYDYEGIALSPATLTQPPIRKPMGYAFDVLSGWPRTPVNIRMYAGQVDPNDASHFTIRYEMWGQNDVLDGYLKDDDQVTLTPRKQLEEPR